MPHLQGAEGVLHRFAPQAHGLRVGVEALLHRFENMLVLPSRDATARRRRASVLDGARIAGIRPIAPQIQAVLKWVKR
jgi:hypothetical protein